MSKNKGRVVGLDVHPDNFAGAVVALVNLGGEGHGVLVHVILTCDGVTRHPPSSAHLRAADGHDGPRDLGACG